MQVISRRYCNPVKRLTPFMRKIAYLIEAMPVTRWTLGFTHAWEQDDDATADFPVYAVRRAPLSG